MEENRKRPGYEETGEFAGKRPRTSATSDDTENNEGEDMMAWLSIDDETVSELAKLLETEITSPVKVKFIDNPYSSALIFQSSSSSYITINGNEESCGSSFSDSESSVMASIDMRGINTGHQQNGVDAFSGWFPAAEGRAWSLNDEIARGKVEEDEEGCSVKGINGSDCWDYDDDMLARFLGEDLFQSLD
uniref:Uncharacterized protein n=1 Tax=Davidia involucrata TaxID=16924 RepID=A0A5B7C520_DAVIN